MNYDYILRGHTVNDLYSANWGCLTRYLHADQEKTRAWWMYLWTSHISQVWNSESKLSVLRIISWDVPRIDMHLKIHVNLAKRSLPFVCTAKGFTKAVHVCTSLLQKWEQCSACSSYDLGRRDFQFLIDSAAKILVKECAQLVVLVLQAVYISQVVGPCLKQSVVALQLLFQGAPHPSALITASTQLWHKTLLACNAGPDCGLLA